jgi:hypothetical protein
VQLLGGDQREAFIERKPHLVAKDRQRTGTRAVVFFDAAAENELH